MAFEVLMPKLSSTMAEGSITQWFKEEGEYVEVGEAIFEVMTDKIAIEVEAYEEGTLLKRYYEADQMVPINAVVAFLGKVGEEVPDQAPSIERRQSEPIKEQPQSDSSVSVSQEIRATPAARKLAREKGIELSHILGSGRHGRIHLSDVTAYSVKPNGVPAVENQELFSPWKGLRRAVADTMVTNSQTIPHVTMEAQVNLKELVLLRQQLLPVIEEQNGKRLSLLEFMIKGVTVALKQFPRLNAHVLEDGIHEFSQVNMAVAVGLTDGLVVPVIKGVNQLGLADLTEAVKVMTEKAREGKLTSAEVSDGTFTISSLGKGVVRHFTPIINGPQVAILGVGSLYEAAYSVGDQVEMHPTLTLSLSFDHRAIDGAPVAEFLSVLVGLLEQPYGLLL